MYIYLILFQDYNLFARHLIHDVYYLIVISLSFQHCKDSANISVCKVLDSELLDPKKTSQAFWIDMQKLAQEKIESMSTQKKE